MPKHRQMKCTDKECTGMCHACTLSCCSVCRGAEGTLTTDCPGVLVSSEVSDMVYNKGLNYTDDKKWHKGEESNPRRKNNFETKEDIEKRTVQIVIVHHYESDSHFVDKVFFDKSKYDEYCKQLEPVELEVYEFKSMELADL